MKIKISPQHRSTLEAHRAAINHSLNNYRKALADFDRVSAHQPEYMAALANLEADTDYETGHAVQAFLVKQGQVDLIAKKLALAQQTINATPAQMLELLRELRPLISAATRGAVADVTREITTSLTPAFGQGAPLEHAASQSPKLAGFIRYFDRQWAVDGPSSVLAAPQALALLDELIAGEIAWTFSA